MKITTFVALSLLSLSCWAESLSSAVQAIETEWASIYYKLPKIKQEAAFDALLSKSQQLAEQFPGSGEPLFWQALVMATNAELQDGFTALKAIHKSRELLQAAIKIDPNTANGSAYVTLGTLYYMAPSWPIAFGDDKEAEKMFQAALKANPNGIDVNYFYGDFLLATNNQKAAQEYFKRALSAPARKKQFFADSMLKEEAKLALSNTKERKINGVKNAFFSLFNSASLK